MAVVNRTSGNGSLSGALTADRVDDLEGDDAGDAAAWADTVYGGKDHDTLLPFNFIDYNRQVLTA